MYFKSRIDAGQQLAKHLEKFKNDSPVIVALSDGGIVVGAQIVDRLKCLFSLLLMEPIMLPGEPDPVAVINQDGGFTYNDMFSTGQLEEFQMEYYKYIEQAKVDKISEIHRLLGKGGIIDRRLLQDKTIILVSDGLNNGFSLAAAVDYLKPVRYKKLVVATPLATVAAVDKMHVLVDQICCLSVVESFFETNHYYTDNRLPDHETLIKTVQDIVESWQNVTA